MSSPLKFSGDDSGKKVELNIKKKTAFEESVEESVSLSSSTSKLSTDSEFDQKSD